MTTIHGVAARNPARERKLLLASLGALVGAWAVPAALATATPPQDQLAPAQTSIHSFGNDFRYRPPQGWQDLPTGDSADREYAKGDLRIRVNTVGNASQPELAAARRLAALRVRGSEAVAEGSPALNTDGAHLQRCTIASSSDGRHGLCAVLVKGTGIFTISSLAPSGMAPQGIDEIIASLKIAKSEGGR